MTTVMRSLTWLVALALQARGVLAFIAPKSSGPGAETLQVEHPGLRVTERPSQGGGYSATAAAALASSAVAMALLRRSRRDDSLVTGHYQAVRNRVERKWWYVEEDRDPTTLPLWQRDYRFGFQVLRRSMIEARKNGKKIFWDVRVTNVKENGCEVEMLNSGLMGWMPISNEGLEERPKTGDILKAECTACPMQRVNKELKWSPWPQIYRSKNKAQPTFSHYLWLEQQRSIKKAQDLKHGDIIKAVVHAHCPKGLVMTLEGEGNPKGMLDMHDISRKKSSHKWVSKMFPIGTEMTVYVVHADKQNGRITLSTKEFEDDDHVGWMLSFPERCFARAEESVARLDEKRRLYIQWLQR